MLNFILGLNLVLTHGIPPDFRAASIYLYKPPYAIGSVPSLSGDAIAYRCVHYRESAGIGPANLKVVPVTGAAILQVTMDQLMCASLFPHLLMV